MMINDLLDENKHSTSSGRGKGTKGRRLPLEEGCDPWVFFESGPVGLYAPTLEGAR